MKNNVGSAEHVACAGQKGNACKELYRKPDGMGPPGSPTGGLKCAQSLQPYLTEMEQGRSYLCGYNDHSNTPQNDGLYLCGYNYHSNTLQSDGLYLCGYNDHSNTPQSDGLCLLAQ